MSSVENTAAVPVAQKPKRRRIASRYYLAVAGGVILLAWIFVAIAAPWIAPYAYDAVSVEARLMPPSAAHWFGTDALGRDVLSRVIWGARISLTAGLTVALVGALMGALIGAVAAYAGGLADELLMRLTDLMLSFLPIVLAMAIAAALGIGVVNTVIAMLIVWWPKYARLGRAMVLTQRSQEYVEAARVLGFGPGRILFRHISPNALGPLIVLMTLDVGNAIITFAGLSFLGLGVVPPTPEWGAMVAEGSTLIEQWWVATAPGFAIFSVVMAFNFLGDGVRDWLDPKSSER